MAPNTQVDDDPDAQKKLPVGKNTVAPLERLESLPATKDGLILHLSPVENRCR